MIQHQAKRVYKRLLLWLTYNKTKQSQQFKPKYRIVSFVYSSSVNLNAKGASHLIEKYRIAIPYNTNNGIEVCYGVYEWVCNVCFTDWYALGCYYAVTNAARFLIQMVYV